MAYFEVRNARVNQEAQNAALVVGSGGEQGKVKVSESNGGEVQLIRRRAQDGCGSAQTTAI